MNHHDNMADYREPLLPNWAVTVLGLLAFGVIGAILGYGF